MVGDYDVKIGREDATLSFREETKRNGRYLLDLTCEKRLLDARTKKLEVSEEAIRKIAYKQTMCRICRRTGNDEDYTNYKEALNAATAEIRQSKIS